MYGVYIPVYIYKKLILDVPKQIWKLEIFSIYFIFQLFFIVWVQYYNKFFIYTSWFWKDSNIIFSDWWYLQYITV